MSNSQSLETKNSVAQVSEEDESYAKATTGCSPNIREANLAKLLGVLWNSSQDYLTFNFNELIEYANSFTANKHSLLKLTAKIFDPLGFLSPFVFIQMNRICVLDSVVGMTPYPKEHMTSGEESFQSFTASMEFKFLDVIFSRIRPSLQVNYMGFVMHPIPHLLQLLTFVVIILMVASMLDLSPQKLALLPSRSSQYLVWSYLVP